jgi:hypothetical protein
MAFPIIPIHNAIATSELAPLAGNLQLGEIAINIQTNKLYVKGNSGTVTEIGGTQNALTTNDISQLATPGKIPQLNEFGLISAAQIQALTTAQVSFLTTTAVAGLVPQLGIDGKIPSALLPAASVGALTYKGAWTVNTSPVMTETTAGGVAPAKGDYYVAANNGEVSLGNNISQILAGDIIAWNGADTNPQWDLIHGARNEVISVASVTPIDGNIPLSPSDIGAVDSQLLTTLATPNSVPLLGDDGKISAVQIPALTTNQLAVCTTAQLGILSIDPISSNSFFVSAAGAAKIIPGTSTVVGGIKSSATIRIEADGTCNVAGAGTY